jgi:hypothetical protein
MAGLGKKIFVANDVLTAAEVNGYLMDQAVMVFDDSSARSSAIGTATEGMVSYLKDTDAVQYYDGSSWTDLVGGINFASSTATSYTVQTSDASSIIRFTASSAVTVTMSTATGFTAGQSVDILMDGAGTVTIEAGTDVTVYGRGTAGTAYAIGQQYDAVSVLCVASDSYRVIGNAEAV